jgi:hypothetical protein
MTGEESGEISKEEINTNESSDTLLSKKIKFSSRKVPVKKAVTHKKKK